MIYLVTGEDQTRSRELKSKMIKSNNSDANSKCSDTKTPEKSVRKISAKEPMIFEEAKDQKFESEKHLICESISECKDESHEEEKDQVKSRPSKNQNEENDIKKLATSSSSTVHDVFLSNIAQKQ